MSDRFSDADVSREALSALADGEARSHEVARACAAWKDDAQTRADWHAYQLIGDVMRSDDLAQTSGGAAFLHAFRARLAQEPVVLAPHARAISEPGFDDAVVAALPAKRRLWAGPVAVAAGFVMVIGALMSAQVIPGGSGRAGERQGAELAQAGGTYSSVYAGDAALNAGFAPTLSLVNADQGRNKVLASGPSFNRPDSSLHAGIHDPQVDQVLTPAQRPAVLGASFAGQGELVRNASVAEAP